jgi:hypothetical protein
MLEGTDSVLNSDSVPWNISYKSFKNSLIIHEQITQS